MHCHGRPDLLADCPQYSSGGVTMTAAVKHNLSLLRRGARVRHQPMGETRDVAGYHIRCDHNVSRKRQTDLTSDESKRSVTAKELRSPFNASENQTSFLIPTSSIIAIANSTIHISSATLRLCSGRQFLHDRSISSEGLSDHAK